MKIVIPSKKIGNLQACITAIYRMEPSINSNPSRIVVVNDGLEGDYEGLFPEVTFVQGDKPFIFAKNSNIGIRAADDDVILLNDDAILQSHEGFTNMWVERLKNPEFGVVGCVTNSTGNRNQVPQGQPGIREDPRMVCFIGVLIPKHTQNVVGMLDERFIHYGFDDDDYCLRVKMMGLKIGIFDGCYVNHTSEKSTFRERGHLPLEPGLEVFVNKWGRRP